MKYIEEKNAFTEEILLLEADTPVKGYDGTDIGPANEQAQALANRTLWLKNELENISGSIKPEPTPNELTIVDVESMGSNVKFVYPTPIDYQFDYYALAFKDVEASSKRTETVDYTTELSNIKQSEPPTSNEKGYFSYGDSVAHQLTKIDDGTVEQYQTEEIKDYLNDGILVQLKVEQATNSVVPITTSNTVGQFNLVSSEIYSGFEPWKAFQTPLTESQSVRVENYGYWSDVQIWQNRSNEVWLGVTSDTAFDVSGYSFQSFEALYWTNTSTPITAWELQGRNSNDDAWVSLDTQEGQVIMKKGNDWNTYLLKESVNYKQYRILVNDVSLKSARASIPRLRFLTEPKVLIKDVNDAYYTIQNGDVLTPLDNVTADTFAESGFRHHVKPIKISDISANLPVKLVSVDEGIVNTQLFTSANQITTHIPLPNTETWEGLLSIKATEFMTDTDGENIKVGFSVDGETCLVMEKGSWIELGNIALTDEYAKSLLSKGLSLGDLAQITSTEWESLLEHSVGAGSVFGIIYVKTILNKDESVVPKEVQIAFDEVRYWQQMSLDKVKIIITKDFITFRPLEKGKYKFCYRFN